MLIWQRTLWTLIQLWSHFGLLPNFDLKDAFEVLWVAFSTEHFFSLTSRTLLRSYKLLSWYFFFFWTSRTLLRSNELLSLQKTFLTSRKLLRSYELLSWQETWPQGCFWINEVLSDLNLKSFLWSFATGQVIFNRV